MIAFVHGKLFSKAAGIVLVECNGVGYEVIVSMKTFDKLPVQGSDVLLYTHFSVREDAQVLFGFLDINELQIFKLLISVNGIGPKSAIGILSSVTPEDLLHMLLEGNTAKLTKLPGVGKKSAERLILELKEKIKKIHIDHGLELEKDIEQNDMIYADEAVNALISLGYKAHTAEHAVEMSMPAFTSSNNKTVETLIKLSLKNAMK